MLIETIVKPTSLQTSSEVAGIPGSNMSRQPRSHEPRKQNENERLKREREIGLEGHDDDE